MRGRGAVEKAKDERGQAMVELVLILPFFIGLLFAVAWVGVGFYRYLQVADAAHSAARAGSTSRFTGAGSPCAAADSKVNDIGIGAVTNCANADPGDDFTFTVEYDYTLTFPFFNELNPPSIHMETTVTQRVE